MIHRITLEHPVDFCGNTDTIELGFIDAPIEELKKHFEGNIAYKFTIEPLVLDSINMLRLRARVKGYRPKVDPK